MNKIFHDLYLGQLALSERGKPNDPEYATIEGKIFDISEHFQNTLPPDEWKRFEELENLYISLSTIEEVDTFTYGLCMGISLMIGVTGFDLQEKFYTNDQE